MLQLIVVDEMDGRRAATIDALCELPGVEVCANASDAGRALTLLDYLQADIVVAPSDMTGASIVMLIDGVRRRGSADVIVTITTPTVLDGMKEYWRDLGARAVVSSLPELVAQVKALTQRPSKRERRAQIASRIENAVVTAQPGHVASASGAAVVRVDPPVRATPLVAVGDVLYEVLPRLARMVHEEIELVLEVASDLPRVRCTASDIERIALYLVQDAARAMPLGGKIFLFVEREGLRHVRIEALDSSGRSRTPGPSADSVRMVVDRYAGTLRVVELGNAISLQAVLPAFVAPAN
jgi:hypothetical protein